MSRLACGCYILLYMFPTLPSGRDVKTCGYLGLCLGVCICLVALLVSCLLMTLMANQTKWDQQTTSWIEKCWQAGLLVSCLLMTFHGKPDTGRPADFQLNWKMLAGWSPGVLFANDISWQTRHRETSRLPAELKNAGWLVSGCLVC